VDETRIITTEGLTTCLDPEQGWTTTSGGWNFLKKQECWEGHEQALIATIRKEITRTEELEEAGYRSLAWALLRALQQINYATKIEGGAATSAPPLRVEFLLKTDSGYPRDAEVTLCTLANPEHSLRFNTHRSAPPVSALARSGGPRKMSQSPVSRNSNIERRMDRPRAVVGAIRGVA